MDDARKLGTISNGSIEVWELNDDGSIQLDVPLGCAVILTRNDIDDLKLMVEED